MCWQKRKIRVLIADDEKCIRELLCYLLQERGFIVEDAKDGKETLEKITQHKPDIIILDLAMPQMNGIEVYRQLKENSDMRNIPIIFFSAQEPPPQITQEISGATIKYIKKPCDIKYLLAQINNLIS